MLLPTKVRLTRCDSKEPEIADIECLNHQRSVANIEIDKAWWTDLHKFGLKRDPNGEPDRDWDWRGICSRASNRRDCEVRGIRTKDGHIQAATSYFIEKRSALVPDKKTIYIDRIATAPWNRAWLVNDPQYNRCGLALIRYVVAHSRMLGLEGRVNLTAVAHVDFYLSLGFVETQERNGDGSIYELSTEAARQLMDGQRGFA